MKQDGEYVSNKRKLRNRAIQMLMEELGIGVSSGISAFKERQEGEAGDGYV